MFNVKWSLCSRVVRIYMHLFMNNNEKFEVQYCTRLRPTDVRGGLAVHEPKQSRGTLNDTQGDSGGPNFHLVRPHLMQY